MESSATVRHANVSTPKRERAERVLGAGKDYGGAASSPSTSLVGQGSGWETILHGSAGIEMLRALTAPNGVQSVLRDRPVAIVLDTFLPSSYPSSTYLSDGTVPL